MLARGGDPPGTPRCAPRPERELARHTGYSPGHKAGLAVLARGDDPPEPPAALRAPQWYLADTPATRRAKAGLAGPVTIASP